MIKSTFAYLCILCLITIVFIGCTDDQGSSLSEINACDYIYPPANSTQVYSNDLSSFTLEMGPDTATYTGTSSGGGVLIYALSGKLENGHVIAYACGDDGAQAIGPNEDDWYNFLEEADAIQDDYFDGSNFDARSLMEDLLDKDFLQADGFPLIMTLPTLFYNATEETLDDVKKGSLGISISINNPEAPTPPRITIATISIVGQLKEHLSSYQVNDVEYEDVIKVEIRCTAYQGAIYHDGDDSPIREIIADYWFAKGIGMIETTDRDYRLNS